MLPYVLMLLASFRDVGRLVVVGGGPAGPNTLLVFMSREFNGIAYC